MMHGKIKKNMMKNLKKIGAISNPNTPKKKNVGSFLKDIKLPKE